MARKAPRNWPRMGCIQNRLVHASLSAGQLSCGTTSKARCASRQICPDHHKTVGTGCTLELRVRSDGVDAEVAKVGEVRTLGI